MAQERSPTPEKQLLKLIEGQEGKGTGMLKTRAVRHQGLSLFSFGAWLGRFSFSKEKVRERFSAKGLPHLDVKVINRILVLCMIALMLYTINSFYVSTIDLKKKLSSGLALQKDIKSVSLPETSILKKANSYYLEEIQQRDIFKIGQKKIKNPKEQAAGQFTPSRIVEATQNLRLVGISWSSDPDAMIEDTKALRTYFVKRGGMVADIKVRAIFKDKVILSYDGEEIELK